MAKLKNILSGFFRKIGILYFLDYFIFLFQKARNSSENKVFLAGNPGTVLPPDYMIYESFQLNYRKYYTDSLASAASLAALFGEYVSLYNVNILDWGCGPARIIRHLPGIIGGHSSCYGTDYNQATIRWCSANIPGVTFSVNRLDPPMDFHDSFFHVIYGISIFTHLSEERHHRWIDELFRLLKPGGILVITTQGNDFLPKMTQEEKDRFRNGNLVIRGNVKEGHRTYSAFQPELFMKALLKDFVLLRHTPGHNPGGRPQQDTWVAGKQAQAG